MLLYWYFVAKEQKLVTQVILIKLVIKKIKKLYRRFSFYKWILYMFWYDVYKYEKLTFVEGDIM